MTTEACFWDDLLLYLGQNQVIAIIGQDLLQVEIDGRPINAYALLAERLAGELGIAPETLPPNFTLSQVVAAHPRFRHHRSLVYSHTKGAFDQLNVPLPDSLQLLAKMTSLRIFLTTTFDTWMTQALLEERKGMRTKAICYTPEESSDLAPEDLYSDQPIVYQMFGQVAAAPRYAVTDEDLLEYLHNLQARPPRNLCEALRKHHLLLIGTAFSDWLARFFVRTARGDRLIIPNGKEVFIVDNELERSSSMVSFFRGFSWETNILPGHTPGDFVRILFEKWNQRHGPGPSPASPLPPQRVVLAEPSASHFIFISYSSDDASEAEQVFTSLRNVGLNPWMDKKGGLQGGERYETRIRDDIRRCTLFVAILSRRSARRKEGFFRREWDEAITRLSRFKGSSRPFILPIVVDDLDLPAATDLPTEFKDIHALKAPAGVLANQDSTSIRDTVRGIIKEDGGLA